MKLSDMWHGDTSDDEDVKVAEDIVFQDIFNDLHAVIRAWHANRKSKSQTAVDLFTKIK